MRSDKLNVVEYIRPIGIRRDGKLVKFAGTGFGFEKPGLVLTAAHVVANATNPQDVYMQLSDGRFLRAYSMNLHSTADVAALLFESDQSLPFFKLGNPPTEIREFFLGTEILSYGYPLTRENPDKIKLEPRLMSGHIQRYFCHEQGNYSFYACELSFPSILGQSGSPILLAHDIDSAIAVLTTNFESSIVIDSYEEHDEGGQKEIHKIKKVISYGLGAALWPLSDWIRSL